MGGEQKEGERQENNTSQSLSHCGTQEEIIIFIWCNWVKFIDRDDQLSAWSLQGLKKSTSWIPEIHSVIPVCLGMVGK